MQRCLSPASPFTTFVSIARYPFEWGVFSSSNLEDRFSANPLNIAKLTFRLPIFLLFLDGLSTVFLCAVASVPILVSNIRNRKIDVYDKIQLWGWCLFIMRILTVGIQEQQAPRYLFPLAWSLLIINAVFFYRLFRISAVSSVTRFEKMLIFAPALTVLVSQFAAVQFPESRATEMRIVFVFVIAAILVFVWLTRKNGKAAFLGSLVILLLFKLYTFQYHIVNWTATSTDSYYRALKDLHARLPPDCIIMGRMSGFVALEHPCRAYWPHTMRPDIQPPDFIIINGGREEIEGFASTNPFLAERLFSPDTTWMPLKYDIMNNYYSDRPTWVFRLRKPERAPPVIPSFWSVVYRRLTPGETCSPGTPAFSSAPPYGRRCSAAR